MSIVLEELSKFFGENAVINRISLKIQDGELFVFLGGSGSGKSTILRLIAGLLQPDNGRIKLHGQDVTYLSPQQRNTGFVFQNYSVFRHMTVVENIAFGLRIRKIASAEQQQRVSELLELVGLTGLGTRYPDQLSGGQLQRVALARALAYRPAVLLLDEPFSALDVKIRTQLRQSLKEIQRQLAVTTILVTHDQHEAFELADRIGVVERGHIIEVGAPEDLYHRPQIEFTATFVGGGNVLVGRLVSGQIRLGSVDLPFPEGAPVHDEGAPVRILFRPETLLLQAEPFAADSGVHVLGQGQVIERLFAGSAQLLKLALTEMQGVRPLSPPPVFGQQATIVQAAQASTAVSSGFEPGRQFWLGLRHYHVLQPTGLKIMIFADESPSVGDAVAVGCQLAQAAGGPVSLLAVAENDQQIDLAQQRVESLARPFLAALPQLHKLVRQGRVIREIAAEVEAGYYEMVVVSSQEGGINSSGWQILNHTQRPVLMVPASQPQIKQILICTAAGEPGKSDVRFAGRLARHTKAQATLFHVQSPQAWPYEVARSQRHLQMALASLQALGVASQIKTAINQSFVETIVTEAKAGDYDLVVIGAPAPHAPQQLIWSDMASQIVSGTNRPVVVVPMME
jgi:sulfate transport system ATP-binding protein